MVAPHRKGLLFTLAFFIFIALLASHVAAMRPLGGDQWIIKKEDGGSRLAFQSLQRGPVTPSGGSPCSFIPGGSGVCTLNGKNFAGRNFAPPPPAFPSLDMNFGVASTAK